jgi:hypothetical protein
MRVIAFWTMAALICIVPATAAPKTKPKLPSSAQLQVQIKKLTQERDDLKDRLAATENLQQDLAAAQKSKELARQEADGLRKELDDIKSSLSENQSGTDSILKDLQKAKADLEACQSEKQSMAKELEDSKAKAQPETPITAGVSDLVPAKPINLNRVTPKVRNVSRGVVVVNVLINEAGEVLDTRLIQGLPGTDADVKAANEACTEAAKRIVFDPARSADGTTKVRVWQAVGFLVD